jgi:hypothetical protein
MNFPSLKPSSTGVTKMDTVKLFNARKQGCPMCDLPINAASLVSGEGSPGPGDITVCVHCKAILTYGEAMELQPAKPEAIEALRPTLTRIIDNLTQTPYTVIDTPDGPAILCHACGNTSYNRKDTDNHYCGHCHKFLDVPNPITMRF